MLNNLDQNTDMGDTKTHKISLHHTNLFRPKPIGITLTCTSSFSDFLVVVKDYEDRDKAIKNPISIIEVYKIIVPTYIPKLSQSIIVYEKITGIVFYKYSYILTTSHDQTITLYNYITGTKVCSLLTDYGPITCAKYKEKLLLTGTEYGYVVAYSIADEGEGKFSIKPENKMVKINGKIQSLDFVAKPKKVNQTKQPKTIVDKKPVKLGKRKRTSTSSEESSEDESKNDDEDETVFMSKFDITIYGSSQRLVTVWDYHKKSIFETITVGDDDKCYINTILTFRNGDLLVGDSTGTVNLYDCNSLTCKQSLNCSQSEILCLATNPQEQTILLSGKDPSIVILRKEKGDDHFRLHERIELHVQDVTSISFSSKKNFFSASLDGILARYHLSKSKDTRLKLGKKLTIHNYSNHIKYTDQQMMVQSDKSLTIWKLPKVGSDEAPSQEKLDEAKPVKLLLIKTRGFIQASTFNERWIVYASNKGVYIFDRLDEVLTSHGIDKKISNCTRLELCSNEYLIAAESNKLHLIKLEATSAEETEDFSAVEKTKPTSIKFPALAEKQLTASVTQLLYIESLSMLVVACSSYKGRIYKFKLDSSEPTSLFESEDLVDLGFHEISFVAQNIWSKKDNNLYIYTFNDVLIKLNLKKSVDQSKFKDLEVIQNLPEDVDALGLFVLGKDQCIVYDSRYMMKLDLKRNSIVRENSDYKFIVKMDNSAFDDPNEVSLVELTPEDYRDGLPTTKTKLKKKFGL